MTEMIRSTPIALMYLWTQAQLLHLNRYKNKSRQRPKGLVQKLQLTFTKESSIGGEVISNDAKIKYQKHHRMQTDITTTVAR